MSEDLEGFESGWIAFLEEVLNGLEAVGISLAKRRASARWASERQIEAHIDGLEAAERAARRAIFAQLNLSRVEARSYEAEKDAEG